MASSSRKVRVKKLNVKTTLPVLREDQIDPAEYESLTTETQIATGVEAGEENVRKLRPCSTPRHAHGHVIWLGIPCGCRQTVHPDIPP